jgi:uncharacterized protein YbgA (DUF1722 family)/uncharacterized protein YbbK (DUF523 family)
MNNFTKPVVIVSKCLGFASCRYNGVMIHDPFVKTLRDFIEFIPVCPEVTIGLGIPRDPIRIVMEGDKRLLYQPSTRRDITEPMNLFIRDFFATHNGIDGFLLKNRSPSCGIGDVKIYQSKNADAGSTRGAGIFGRAVLDHFPHYPVEDEGRLHNIYIREHFLTKLYTVAAFQRLERKLNQLINFHTRNKLLFMSYHESLTREMGTIVANHDHKPVDDLFFLYQDRFFRALAHPPSTGTLINSVQHAFGGFSKDLTKDEKHYFLNVLEEYRDERIPFSVITHLLSSWTIKYNNQYILDQTFIHPFPPELVRFESANGKRDYTFY